MPNRFTSDERAVWGGFLRAHAQLDQLIDADLRAHEGISHVEYEVLLRLRHSDGERMRIQELANDSLLTRSGTSRLVDRLVSAGLVERAAAPEDRRGSYAVLTDAGRARFDGSVSRHVELVRARFLDRLTPEEMQTLAEVWRKVADSPEP